MDTAEGMRATPSGAHRHEGVGAGTAEKPHPTRERMVGAVAAGLGAVAALLVFLVVRRSLIDDAYITLSYARNLAENFQWGLTSYRSANSATSPLNVLGLGTTTFVMRDAVRGLALFFVLLNALQAWGLVRLARHLELPLAAAGAAFALVLLSPLMLSAVGMEMTLAATLLVWLTVAAVERRWIAFGVLAGLLVLTRIDLAVFPVVLLLATPFLLRRMVRVVGVTLATVAPWFLFSWVVLGALLPDTLIIKTLSTSAWGPWQFANGPLLYLERYPAATVISSLPAAIGGTGLLVWLVTRAWRSARWRGLGPLAALAGGGVLHFLAYCLLGPPPFHWYYAPAAMALSLAGVLGLGRLAPAPETASRPAAAPLVARLLAAAVVAAILVTDLVAVLVRPLPWREVPITTNWATAQQYEDLAEQLQARVGDDVVRSPGEIGALAYHCRCDIVDPFSDRGILLTLLDQLEAESGPAMRALLRVNFANLDRDVAAAQPSWALVYYPGAPTGEFPVESQWRGRGAFALVPAENAP